MTPSRPQFRAWLTTALIAAVWLLTSAAAALAMIPATLNAPAELVSPENRVSAFIPVEIRQPQCSQEVSRGPPLGSAEHTYFVGQQGVWVHNDCKVRARIAESRRARESSNFRTHAARDREIQASIPRSPSTQGSRSGGSIFRGDDNFSGGSVGLPIDRDFSANDIISHIQQKSTGDPFVSFSTKRSAGSADSRGAAFFGKKIVKVDKDAIAELVASGQIKILTPDDVFNFLRGQSKKKIRAQAGNIRANMIRNNELLVQGEIPAGLVSSAN